MAQAGPASDSETQLNRNYFPLGRKLEARVNCGQGRHPFILNDTTTRRHRHDYGYWNRNMVMILRFCVYDFYLHYSIISFFHIKLNKS